MHASTREKFAEESHDNFVHGFSGPVLCSRCQDLARRVHTFVANLMLISVKGRRKIILGVCADGE